MASVRYVTVLCQSRVACDGAEIHRSKTMCNYCRDKIATRAREAKEYQRIQALVAAAERNGRRKEGSC